MKISDVQVRGFECVSSSVPFQSGPAPLWLWLLLLLLHVRVGQGFLGWGRAVAQVDFVIQGSPSALSLCSTLLNGFG